MDQRKKEALKKLNGSLNNLKKSTTVENNGSKHDYEISISSLKNGNRLIGDKIVVRTAATPSRSDDSNGKFDESTATAIDNMKLGINESMKANGGTRLSIKHRSVVKSSTMHSIMDEQKYFLDAPRKPLIGLSTSGSEYNNKSEMNRYAESDIIPTKIQFDHIVDTSVRSSTSFLSPPENESGISIDVSDRPLLCASASCTGKEIIVGGANHSVYSVRTNDKTKQRTVKQMYSKRFGHSDWVTSVAHTINGKAISTGMDGKLCLWDESRSTCIDIHSHVGSISKILASEISEISFSCGYDGKIYAYSLKDKPKAGIRRASNIVDSSAYIVSCMAGHSAPIIDIDCNDCGHLISAARDGDVYIWDTSVGSIIRKYHGHKGSANKVLPVVADSNLWLSSGVDGCIKLYDAREKTFILSVEATKTNGKEVGVAAIGAMVMLPMSSGYLLGAGSSDGSISIIDIRRGGEIVARWGHHKGPVYSLCFAGSDCLLSGDGSGMLLCYDLNGIGNSALRYGLCGSEFGGVQSIVRTNNCVVSCGESGKILFYDF